MTRVFSSRVFMAITATDMKFPNYASGIANSPFTQSAENFASCSVVIDLLRCTLALANDTIAKIRE